MFQSQTDPTFRFVPILIGVLAFALALLGPWLLRFLELPALSEAYTTPRYRRSARFTKGLSRLCLVLVGIGFLVQGIGTIVLPPEAVEIVSLAVLVLSAFVLLVIIGVVLASR